MSTQPKIGGLAGLHTVTADKIWAALQRIIQAVDPVAMIAFGSRARGNQRADSDLDLAVLLDPAGKTKPTTALWSLFSDLQLRVDLIVMDEPQHLWLSRSRNSIHHSIAHEGVVLYDKRVHGSPDRSAVEKISR
jgi:predicted nucleotidyltransferase